MTTIIGITAFLLAAVERFSRLRFRPSPLFRRYFASDMFYLLTGFVAGGSLVIAYVASSSRWVGDWWGYRVWLQLTYRYGRPCYWRWSRLISATILPI